MLIIVSCIFTNVCVGQGYVSAESGNLEVVDRNGNDIKLRTNHIYSDFGLRNATGASMWHRGVDFNFTSGNGDLGYTIKSFTEGRIASIDVEGDYKILSIDGLGGRNFGYGHIFRSDGNALGDFEFIYVQALVGYVIIYLPGDENNSYALTSASDATIAALTPFEHDSVFYGGTGNNLLTNDVKFGDPIAPLGDAGQTGSAHIHLYNFVDPYTEDINVIQYPDNCKDPLEFLNHDEPYYNVTINQITNRNGTEPTAFEVWTEMCEGLNDCSVPTSFRYSNVVMNVDEVSLRIRKEHEAENEAELIKGPNFDSKISLGAKLNSIRYPSAIHTRFGSTTTTGFEPIAYRDNGGYPRDNFFFADFVTRISKDHSQGQTPILVAGINEDARYGDGKYYIKPEVITVLSTKPITNETEFLIDNFRPFIQKVVIRSVIGGEILYVGEWKWENGSNNFYSESYQEFVGSALVEVTTSEPMNTLDVSLADVRYDVAESINNFRNVWTFAIDIITSDPQTLQLEGTDTNGNDLDSNPASIAIRTGPGANGWTGGADPGIDENHNFNQPCNQGAAPSEKNDPQLDSYDCSSNYVAINASTSTPQIGEAVIISAEVGSYTSLSWDFGSNAEADNTDQTETTVVFTEEGESQVGLYIDGELAAEQTFWVGTSDQGPIITGLSANGLGTNSGKIGDEFTLQANISGDVVSYQWDFGAAANYADASSANPTVSYYYPGNKNIRLTVLDQNGKSTTYARNSMIIVTDYPGLETEIVSGCSDDPVSGYTTFEHETTGGAFDPGNRTYFWDFGDGNTSTQERPQNLYEKPGYYTVSLTVCDNSGCATDVKEGCVYVGQNGNDAYGNNWIVDLYADGIFIPKEVIEKNIINCPEIENMPVFGVGVPVNFTVDVQRGGNGKDEDYHYNWDFVGQGTCVTFIRGLSATPSSAHSSPDGPYTGPRNHTVVFNKPGIYPVSLSVGSSEPFGGATGVVVNLRVEEGTGSPRCQSGFGNFSLSSTCWDPQSPPVVHYDITYNNCPVEYVDLYTIDQFGNETLVVPEFESGDHLSFDWSGADPGEYTIFHLVANIGEYQSGKMLFDWDPTKQEQVSLATDFSICQGASTSIGIPPTSGKSYLWSGENESYLSGTAESNPVFTGITAGVHTYDLQITDLETGCHSDHEVAITVGEIVSKNLSYVTKAGASAVTLDIPFEGDGRSYEFYWSPQNNLNNPRVANPIFTPPLTGQVVNYTVEARFRDCSASGTVAVEVRNEPPSELSISGIGKGFISLNWKDRSVEDYFEIERNVSGDNQWEPLDQVPSNVSAYTDAYCLNPEIKYCYRIGAYDIKGQFIGYSNTICGHSEYGLYEDWSVGLPDIYGKGGEHFANHSALSSLNGELYERNQNLIVAANTDNSLNTLPCDQDLYVHILKLEDGTTLATKQTFDNPDCYEPGIEDIDVWSDIKASSQLDNGSLILVNKPTNQPSHQLFIENENQLDIIPSEISYFFYPGNNSEMFLEKIGSNRWVFAATIVAKQRNNSYCSQFRSIAARILELDESGHLEFSDTTIVYKQNWGRILHDVMVIPNDRMAFVSVSYEGCGLSIYEDLHVDITDHGLNKVNSKRIAPGLSMKNTKVVSVSNNEFIIASTLLGEVGQDPGYKKIWIAKVSVDDLHVDWSRTFEYPSKNLTLLDVIKRSSDSYVIIGKSDQEYKKLKLISVDTYGETNWETSLSHEDPNMIFDLHYDQPGNLYIGWDHREYPKELRIDKYTTVLPTERRVQVCEELVEGSSYSSVASQIVITDECDGTTFGKGSSANFVTTSSAYIYPGTTIEKGALFSLAAVEEVTKGGCKDTGSGDRIMFAENKKPFEAEYISEHEMLNVYPNPASNWFNVDLHWEEEQEIQLSFTDMMGRELWSIQHFGSEFREMFSVEDLSPGIYLLSIATQSGYTKGFKLLIK